MIGAMAWQPLLDGDQAHRAWACVHEIAEALGDADREIPEPSYAGGLAGIALFYGYLASASDEPRFADTARQCLGRAVEMAAEEDLPAGLLNGLTGLAWTLRHLERLLTGQADPETTEEVDEMLLRMVRISPWTWHFDLTQGLAGIGAYALEHPDPALARDLIGHIVQRLEDLALCQDGGVFWRTPPELIYLEAVREKHPDGYFNLGLAHGIPGVLAVLARAWRGGLAPPSTLRLIDGAVTWLLAQRRPDDGGSSFGSFAVEGAESCRSAWCYGDPGVALALLIAGRALDRPRWRELAIEILLRDLRRPLGETGVVDPNLCHGAAGLGHIYNLFYRVTKRRAFARPARGWFEQTLAMRKPGEGIAGFVNWWPQIGQWRGEPGLLTGAAGVGLAMLAAASPLPPGWGEPMLLDLGSGR